MEQLKQPKISSTQKSPEEMSWWKKLNPSINFIAVAKAVIKLRKIWRQYFLRPRRKKKNENNKPE